MGKIEERIVEALADLHARGYRGATGWQITRAIELKYPPRPLFFGRWGPPFWGLVGYGTLYLGLDHLVRDGKVERRVIQGAASPFVYLLRRV